MQPSRSHCGHMFHAAIAQPNPVRFSHPGLFQAGSPLPEVGFPTLPEEPPPPLMGLASARLCRRYLQALDRMRCNPSSSRPTVENIELSFSEFDVRKNAECGVEVPTRDFDMTALDISDSSHGRGPYAARKTVAQPPPQRLPRYSIFLFESKHNLSGHTSNNCEGACDGAHFELGLQSEHLFPNPR